ncbi:MAG: DUF262 domain-containing protein [Candidatus Sericytochromatia bacterium]|nr:DUF262 domain-containing protein [Candidatus Sericytochromatia bacterium]
MSIDNLLSQIKNVRVSQTQVNRKIKDLISEFKKGEIFIPEYQRAFVWDNTVQSRFIESIFMNIPVPPIFFLEKYDEETGEIKYEVIDGVQRLSTLLSFFDDKLKLSSGLKLSDIERMSFNKLPSPIGNLFLNREITTLIIGRTTHPEIQFEIFERLNRGSVSLSHQELRNCMYHGNFNNFILSLNKYKPYREILSSFAQFKEPVAGEPSKNRMLDVEMILRLFTLFESFCETGKYISPKKDQLNFYMRIKRERENQTLKEDLQDSYSKTNEELDFLFKKCCDLADLIFGNKSFRRFKVSKTEADFIGFNKAVFDIQMLGFMDYQIIDIEDKVEIIYQEFLDISSFNDIFIDSINRSTDHKINERIEIWKDALQDIVTNPQFYFKKLEKHKSLFHHKPECCYCSKQIKNFDDSYCCNDPESLLYHRSCYLNIPNLKPSILKKKSSELSFKWNEQTYEMEAAKALELIVNEISEKIADDSYQLERLKTFEFIGSLEKLRNLNQNNSGKSRAFKPINLLISGEKQFLETVQEKNVCINNIHEFTSCFGFADNFIIL